jgi:hypothetical protein
MSFSPRADSPSSNLRQRIGKESKSSDLARESLCLFLLVGVWAPSRRRLLRPRFSVVPISNWATTVRSRPYPIRFVFSISFEHRGKFRIIFFTEKPTASVALLFAVWKSASRERG